MQQRPSPREERGRRLNVSLAGPLLPSKKMLMVNGLRGEDLECGGDHWKQFLRALVGKARLAHERVAGVASRGHANSLPVRCRALARRSCTAWHALQNSAAGTASRRCSPMS